MLADINVHLVETVDAAQAFLRWLGERRNILAIDTETGGLEWWRQPTRLVQFGDTRTGWAMAYRNWRGVIEQALRNYDGPVAWWNEKFDRHFLEMAGLPMPPLHRSHDGLIMDSLLNPGLPHGLKPVSERMWGRAATAGQQILKQAFAKNKWDWATVPEDFPGYWAYAALDTVLTAKNIEAMWPELNARPELRAAYDREIACQSILYGAERRGMRIDVEYTKNLTDEWLAEMQVLEAMLAQYSIENPNSRAQVIAALEAELEWEPGEFTDSGEPKVDDKVLRALPGNVAPAIIRYRRLRKWSAAYLQHFILERDLNDRVHPTIRTMRARTGRMSITEPPLQTLPRGTEIRDCVIPSEGRHLLAIDYDTMELRALASDADEQALIDAFLAGEDLHRYAAAKVYGKALGDITAAERQITKNTQYGLIYGAGARKLAETAGVGVPEAEAFLATYKATFPGVDSYMRRVAEVGQQRLFAEGKAYVRTTGGRIVPTADDKIYALVNYRIQGSCADIVKQKIVDLDAQGLGDLILLPVHDEVLFDVPVEDFAEVRHLAAETMAETEQFAVPLTVHASGPLTRWGDNYRSDH